jgi:hypothetical protein
MLFLEGVYVDGVNGSEPQAGRKVFTLQTLLASDQDRAKLRGEKRGEQPVECGWFFREEGFILLIPCGLSRRPQR